MLYECLYCSLHANMSFHQENSVSVSGTNIPALPFTKGQSLDPSASDPIRQLYRHTSETVSRLSDVHNMKHHFAKITIHF